MAYGDIHNSTGTICRAVSDASCPLSSDGGHSVDLQSYAEVHGVDGRTLQGLVENAKMTPAGALGLMGSGEMVETPPVATRSSVSDSSISSIQEQLSKVGSEPRTREELYERELNEYKVAQLIRENRMLADYAAAVEARSTSRFAPLPKQPPFRTVYPKSFEAYNDVPKDMLSDSLPSEISQQPSGGELWEEYLRKRKQLGDRGHLSGKSKIYYI